MEDEILPLFRDVLLVCEEMNLLGGTMFALDGCKLPSNASKELSGTMVGMIYRIPSADSICPRRREFASTPSLGMNGFS
jgi:hypothetical protein